MAHAALRLSLKYGAGNLHWFEGLSTADQALLLAHEDLASPAAPGRAAAGGVGGLALLEQHAAKLRAQAGG